MVIAYWKSVVAFAWVRALKFHKVDTKENIAFLLVGLVLVYAVGGVTTGDWNGAFTKPGQALVSLIAGVGLWFVFNIFRSPALMAAEQSAVLADVQARLQAATTRPIPLSLKDARGLLFRLSEKCYEVRMNRPSAADQLAQQVSVDCKILLGYEGAAKIERDFSPLYNMNVNIGIKEEYLKNLQFYLSDLSQNLSSDLISDEMGAREYVLQRLEELRPAKDA